MACPVGTFHDQGSSKCVLCRKGSYQEKEGQASCRECDNGKWTVSTGAVSSNECLKDNNTFELTGNHPHCHKEKAYACQFIDFSKAFDSVRHDRLFYELLNINIVGHFYNVIKSIL